MSEDLDEDSGVEDGDTGAGPIEPPGLGPLDAELPSEHVLGFPLLAGITIRVDQPDAGLRHLPLPILSRLAGSVGLSLDSPGGSEIARRDPRSIPTLDMGTPVFHLVPGETRRTLVEVSDILPFRTIGKGRYLLRVLYASPRSRTISDPAPIQVREPTLSEQQALNALTRERAAAGTWGDWAMLPATDRAALAGPFDPADPLVYLRVLRYLREGAEDLSFIDPAILGAVSGPPAKEAIVLRAELAWARGDQTTFEAIAATVQNQYPGLLWWINKIAEGRSDLVFARSIRPKTVP